MDPAMPLQQRITQGLSDVSQSFRNSISSLVLGAPNSSGSAAAGASTAGANGGGIAGVPDNDNNPSNSVDIDLEKGRAELESYAGGGRGDNDPHSQNGGGTDGGHATNNNDGSRADGDSTSGTAAVEGEGEDEADSASTTEPKPPVHHPQPRPLRLQTLPPEVQMLVIHRLNFGDIERLRRTCRHYHSLCSPHAIRTLFGAATLRLLMISHCGSCLRYDESRESLLIASVTGRDWPLNARCVDCAVSGRDRRLVVGRKITMGNGEGVWVCRWCGWPVVTDAAQGHAQFHEGCYDAYNRVLLWFFMLGWVQLGLGIVGAALAWRYFRDTTWILAPTVTSFILLWVCFFMLMFRGNRVRTYHWTLMVELLIILMWILPVYDLAQDFAAEDPDDRLPRSWMACLIIFSFNLFFRFLNVLGNLILVCEYRRVNHFLPKHMIPFWRRITNPIMNFLIFWTYPQSVEQKYPPHWS